MGRNISELEKTGRVPKQAIAISLSVQREAKGEPPKRPRYRGGK